MTLQATPPHHPPHPTTTPQRPNGGFQEPQINIYWLQLNITQSNQSWFSKSEYFNITSWFRNIYFFDPFKYSGIIRFIRNIYAMYSVSYRYNPNTTNPYSVYKQPNPNIHNFYSVYKKRNYSFPYKFGFGQIIRIWYTPIADTAHHITTLWHCAL